MPEAHKQATRHPKYKTAHRVSNWAAYDRALRDRGDITLWSCHDAIDAWLACQLRNRMRDWVDCHRIPSAKGDVQEIISPAA